QALQQRLALLVDGVLPNARGTVESVLRSYQVGRAEFLTLLSVEDARYRAELEAVAVAADYQRSEEHTSELQSPCNLVCRLLLEPALPAPAMHTLSLHDALPICRRYSSASRSSWTACCPTRGERSNRYCGAIKSVARNS